MTGSNPITSFDDQPQSGWLEEQTRKLMGKHILVGITHCNMNGMVISQEQIHGIVDHASAKNGLTIKLHGTDAMRVVPLNPSSLQMARLGEYRLSGNGEIVKDPDYMMRVALNPKGEMVPLVD